MGSLPSPTEPPSTSLAAAGGAPASLLNLPPGGHTDEDMESVELVPLNDKDSLPAYTSLRDILRPSLSPPPPTSPAGSSSQAWSEIPIRNRLVKQAAWAYLQPMAASPESSGNDLFGRCWDLAGDIRRNLAADLMFFRQRVWPAISRAFGWLLGVLWFGGRRDS